MPTRLGVDVGGTFTDVALWDEASHRLAIFKLATVPHVRITVAGEEIALDFAGTGHQVPGDINVVYLALVATVYYALKALLDPAIPANGGVQVHITNTSNLPVECLEMEYPLLVEEYSLVEDSGGQGRFRGGLGLRRTIRVLAGEATFLGTLDRERVAPWGLFGGGPGGRGGLTLSPGGAKPRPLGSKVAGLRLAEGDAVTIVTPGAGGYGPPAERDAVLIARDLREGKTSALTVDR